MPAFYLVRDHLHDWDASLARVAAPVDRLTLEKRRWRGLAADGVEFGFDLEAPLHDGDVFHVDGQAFYQIEQQPEPVIEIRLGAASDGAKLGWMIGNLHFKIAVTAESIQAPDDPAIRQMLERAGVTFTATDAVFRPLRGAHTHGHHGH